MITLDGRPVHRAELHVPWRGRWEIKVALEGTEPLSGRVSIVWGSTTLVGTVDATQAGAWQGETIATIVGGAGWTQAPPPQWHQSDSPGLNGRTIALQVAGLVSEQLYGPTGTTPPSSTSFRPLRVSYARTKSTAASILDDVLAPGALWWVDFDGATRAGVRVAPSAPARVALLELDPAEGWAELDADDPGQLTVGTVLAADATRGLPALQIVELWAWSGPEGVRFRASVGAAPAGGNSRLLAAFAALARAAAPELPALELRRARVVSQGADGRVSLQQVDRSGELADFGRTEGAVRFYPGVPGTSADLDLAPSEISPGSNPEIVLAFARADWSDPVAFLAAPVGQPGHVPLTVRHEAKTSIRFVGMSNGRVYVGTTGQTFPVARATPLGAYLSALEAWAVQVDVEINVLLVANGLAPLLNYTNAIAARALSASTNLSNIPALRLESE